MPDSTPDRLPVLTLLLAAIGLPAVAGIAKMTQWSWWQTLIFAMLYEALVLTLGLTSDIWKRVSARWVDPIADWIDLSVREVVSPYYGRYSKYLIYRHRTFDVKGLATQGTFALELEHVFVELSVDPTSNRVSTDPLNPSRRVSDSDGRSIWQYLGPPGGQAQNYAILGPPGCGKTTLLKHVALSLAGPRRSRRLRYMPVLLFLREHAELIRTTPNISLEQVIADALSKAGLAPPSGWLAKHLTTGRFLVMLDGLDEIGDSAARQATVDWLDRQIPLYGANRFLVTSRPFGYYSNPLTGVTVLQVHPFSNSQVQRFVENWYRANEIMASGKSDPGVLLAASEGAADLIARLHGAPALADLALNPLLLTMIATVHRYRSSLPGRRVELYAEICEVFLGKRQQARGVNIDLTPGQKQQVLEPLAHQMMVMNTRTVTSTDALTIIAQPLAQVSPSISGLEFLRAVEHSSALLLEREVGYYSFGHLTFQEYLASCHIRSARLDGDLTGRLSDSWWHETILLYAAQGDATEIRLCAGIRQPARKASFLKEVAVG